MCERSTCGSKRARPTDLYAEEGLTFGNIRTNRSLELRTLLLRGHRKGLGRRRDAFARGWRGLVSTFLEWRCFYNPLQSTT